MTITLSLPDDIAQRANAGQEALKALVIEGYRSSALTHLQASRLLNLSRIEFEDFLFANQVHDHACGIDDVKQDLATFEDLRERGLLQR